MIDFTKRVLNEFLEAARALKADDTLHFRYCGLVDQPLGEGRVYLPPGVWCWPTPGPGRPLSYRFPPPTHVLEILCAVRGGVPEEHAGLFDDVTAQWQTEPSRAVETIEKALVFRRGDWEQVTRKMAETLKPWTVSQVRVLYHLCTPLYVNACDAATAWTVGAARNEVFKAFGLSGTDATDATFAAHGKPGKRPPCRYQFWGTEVEGVVEL